MNVYLAVVTHRHGLNTYVGVSDEALQEELAAYCREYWDNFCKDLPIPAGLSEQIDTYFDRALDNEWLEDYGSVHVAGTPEEE